MCYVYTTPQTIYLVTLTMHTQPISICVIPLSLISSPYQRANNGRNIYLHGETPLLLQVVDVHDNCPTSSCSCKHQASAVENLRIAFFSSQKKIMGTILYPKNPNENHVLFFITPGYITNSKSSSRPSNKRSPVIVCPLFPRLEITQVLSP